MSLIHNTFSTFVEILAFEAYVYNFLILDSFKVFLLTTSTDLLGGGSISG